MKMKLEKLVQHEEALAKLAKTPLSDPQKAWDLSVAIDAATVHIKKYKEKQDAHVQKVGKEIEDEPGNFQIEEKDIPAFTDEMNKLLGVAVTVTFPKIPLKLLNGAEVSAANMSAWRDLTILTNK